MKSIQNLLFLIFADFMLAGTMEQFKNARKMFADPLKFYSLNTATYQKEEQIQDFLQDKLQGDDTIGIEQKQTFFQDESNKENNIKNQQNIDKQKNIFAFKSKIPSEQENQTGKQIKTSRQDESQVNLDEQERIIELDILKSKQKNDLNWNSLHQLILGQLENKYLKEQKEFQKKLLLQEEEAQQEQKPLSEISDKLSLSSNTNVQNTLDNKSKESDTSFFGPVYLEDDELQGEKRGHRYSLVRETHQKMEGTNEGWFFDNSQDANEIRKYLLSYQDPRGYTLLHMAAELGDKYFTTMIVYEAKDLNILDKIINQTNKSGFTPLYLLCQNGFRKFVLEKYDLPKWIIRASDEECLPPLEELNDFLNQFKENQILTDDQKVAHGILFTMDYYMPDLIDKRINHNGVEYDQIEEIHDDQGQLESEEVGYKCFKPSRILLVNLLIENGAESSFQTSISKSTPLHWLAYWGDYRATLVMLKKNKPHLDAKSSLFSNTEDFYKNRGAANAYMTFNNTTPADVAGSQGKWMTLFVIIRHFLENYKDIEKVFISEKIMKNYPKDRFKNDKWKQIWNQKNTDEYQVTSQNIELVFFSSKNFNLEQISYLKIAYWTIFVHSALEKDPKAPKKYKKILIEFLYFMLLYIGISPFVEIQQGETLFHACIKTQQINILKIFLSHTFIVQNEKDKQLLIESCKTKDEKGENIFHEVFKLAENDRNQVLKILLNKQYKLKIQVGNLFKSNSISSQNQINQLDLFETDDENSDQSDVEARGDERQKKPFWCKTCCKKKQVKQFSKHQIGEINRANKFGHFPYEYDHNFPGKIEKLPGQKFSEFQQLCLNNEELREIYIESLEGDYYLELMENNKQFEINLIKEKLIENGMREDIDFFVFENPATCFVLKFSSSHLDQIAQEMGLQCDLKEHEARAPFNSIISEEFTMFSEREKFNCISKFLFKDLKLQLLCIQKIIKNHQFMHKKINKKYVKKIRSSFLKLIPKLVFGGWAEDAQIFYLAKRYFGENFAYFLFFFFYFQANLLLPMIFGLILSAYLFNQYLQTGEISALDSQLNSIYAIFMILWATVFAEKWKNNQQKLSLRWSQDQLDDWAQIDERYGDYKNEQYYNHHINKKQIKAQEKSSSLKYISLIFFTIMLSLTIGATVISRWLKDQENQKELLELQQKIEQELDDAGRNLIASQVKGVATTFYKSTQSFILQKWQTIVYRIFLIILSITKKVGSSKIVDLKNHQFNSVHQDEIYQSQFYFEMINTFMPMFVIAFYNPGQSAYSPNFYISLDQDSKFGALFTFLLADNIKDFSFFIRQIYNMSLSKIKEIGLQFIKKPKETYRSFANKEKEWQDFLDKLKEDNSQIDKLIEDENERINHKQLPLIRAVIKRQIDSNLSKLRQPFEINKSLNTLVLQFGIISMFAQCYPVGSFVCFFINLIFLLSIPRLMIQQRRQIPQYSIGIGAFSHIIALLSKISIPINLGLMFFTSSKLYDYFVKAAERLSIFEFFIVIVGLEHLLQLLRAIVTRMVQNDEQKFRADKEIKENFLKDYHNRLNEKQKEVIKQPKKNNELVIKSNLQKLRKQKEKSFQYRPKESDLIQRVSQIFDKNILHFKLYKDDVKDPQAMNETELIKIFREKIALQK